MLAPEQSNSLFTTGGLSAAAIKETQVATRQLLDAAKSGGFKISEAGVEPMRAALLEVRNELDSLGDVTMSLAEAPQLGSHGYGHTVAAHDQKGASGDANSARQVLEDLRQLVVAADEALARAAGVYQEAESQHQDALKGFLV